MPKKRGAIAPKGFTRRYGGSIAARVGVVARDGLDACIYAGTTAPADKAPPPSRGTAAPPGDEYETVAPPPPAEDVDSPPIDEAPMTNDLAPPVADPALETAPAEEPPPPPVAETGQTNQS